MHIQNSRPYTRWWWFGNIQKKDIVYQLEWLKSKGFGGVEIAWIRPWWLNKLENSCFDQQPSQSSLGWLTADFSEYVGFTKKSAQELGLGCDFTFGSAWPFGGGFLKPEDQMQTFSGPSQQRIRTSWEGDRIPVLNHLSKEALDRYAEVLGSAFREALQGQQSALFCDSLEIGRLGIWNPDLWQRFEESYGYDIREMQEFENDVVYDIQKLVGKTLCTNFYEHFSTVCHRLGSYSRVQCHGAPCDLLSAYATADVPESESLLFEPGHSRIAASSAYLANRSMVSCEAFTCMYGFKDKFKNCELVADLKFLADALIANGVNQFIYHGMPFTPQGQESRFWASIHVGPDASFEYALKPFNDYLNTVCSYMRLGNTYSGISVYLPNEDMMMKGDLPDDLLTPGAKDYWEMRYVKIPEETQAFAPTWISGPFIAAAPMQALYIDVEWLDIEALEPIVERARAGLSIILKQIPKQPGHIKSERYDTLLRELSQHACPSVQDAALKPLVQGDVPPYWARESGNDLYIFFAHPETENIRYPMEYLQSEKADRRECHVRIKDREVTLIFEKQQSLLLKISGDEIEFIKIEFTE